MEKVRGAESSLSDVPFSPEAVHKIGHKITERAPPSAWKSVRVATSTLSSAPLYQTLWPASHTPAQRPGKVILPEYLGLSF